jgi:hypothetical protein
MTRQNRNPKVKLRFVADDGQEVHLPCFHPCTIAVANALANGDPDRAVLFIVLGEQAMDAYLPKKEIVEKLGMPYKKVNALIEEKDIHTYAPWSRRCHVHAGEVMAAAPKKTDQQKEQPAPKKNQHPKKPEEEDLYVAGIRDELKRVEQRVDQMTRNRSDNEMQLILDIKKMLADERNAANG